MRRALNLFDHVILAIGHAAHKESESYHADRIELCNVVLEQYGDKVSVMTFEGLLVDFVRAQGAKFILRGLRNMMDFDYEFQMAEMNQALDPDIEYVFLPTSHEFSYLSSSLVREIAALNGDVSKFVHPAVTAALNAGKASAK